APLLGADGLAADHRLDALLVAAPPARPLDAHPAVVLLQAWALADPGRAATELSRLVRRLPGRPRLACDLEGGFVNPLRRFPALSGMPSAARQSFGPPTGTGVWGERVGRQMRSLGLDLCLGPVVDVGREGHLARQRRVFGDDPEVVVRHAAAYVEGLGRHGVGAILKHFPGYGRATTDSDEAPTVIEAPGAVLAADRAVFGRVSAAGVMLSNARYPALDPRPAPLASPVVTLARTATRGVVVTDDLARLGRPVDEDVLRGAFLAGADLLVTSVRLDTVRPTFRRVVGELLRERPALWGRVDASVARIAAL
ncbi:MAG: glycoside hydrolase family 3 N-terminal domain-containing protein, partial [Myxococcota bacterium]